jgi:DNA-binding response OmpR family regulator
MTAAGADRVLVKPFNVDVFRAAVYELRYKDSPA